MKTLRNSFLALLGLAMIGVSYAGPVTAPYQAPEPDMEGGFYVSVAGGALWLDDANIHGVNLDFDTGFSILGAFGYAWENGFAVEIESGYMEVNDAEASIPGLNLDVDGEFRQVPIMHNVVFNLPITDRLSAYIGGGIGVVWSDAEVDSVGGFKIPGGFEFDDEWSFAAQGKAGLSCHISESTSVNIGYRFFYGHDAVGGEDDSIGHILEGGFTFRF